MLLTWEDGYCDDTELRDFVGRMRDDVTFTNENDLFSIGGTIDDVHYAGYPIGLAVADMRYLQYLLGEGVVGKVAYTGSHCWVFCDNLLSGVFTSNLVPECPDEWLVQLTAGVETILLVPVVPHGVVQLGSFDKNSQITWIVLCDRGLPLSMELSSLSYTHFPPSLPISLSPLLAIFCSFH